MKESLVSFFSKVKTNLQDGVYPNEESVRGQIVYPILTRLGWNQEDPSAVRPEHSVSFPGGEKGRVDIALFSGPEDAYAQDQASVYIEVKSIGGIHKAREQLFEYFKSASPGLKAIATDGQIWRLYAFFTTRKDNLVWECDFRKDEAAYEEQADEFVRFLSLDSAGYSRIDEAVQKQLKKNVLLREILRTISGNDTSVVRNHYKMRILLPGYEENQKGNDIPQKPVFSSPCSPFRSGGTTGAGHKEKETEGSFLPVSHNRKPHRGNKAMWTYSRRALKHF